MPAPCFADRVRPLPSPRFAPRILATAALALLLLRPAPAPADGTLTFTGLVPLPDMGAGTYQGRPGGLYPGGRNVRPADHAIQGLRARADITPRNAAGLPDPVQGRIGFLSIGLSNTMMEFAGSPPAVPQTDAYLWRARNDPSRNPLVTAVNGAQGQRTARWWAERDDVWQDADGFLQAAGLTPLQVQAVWMKLALSVPMMDGPFPAHAEVLRENLEIVVRRAKERYPNLAIVYVSSRTRAYTMGIPGHPTESILNPEPYAYESAFAVRDLIEGQIRGDADLNCDAARGPVVAPWITWGPYLWADGLSPRSDGLVWEPADVRETDFTHPSARGAAKVADQLHAFLRTDPTATWSLRAPSAALAYEAVADVRSGPAPLTVRFSTTGAPASTAWNFDDGTASILPAPVKTFHAPGLHEVRLFAASATGEFVIRRMTIAVGVPGPAVGIAAGFGHTAALDDQGAVQATGRNQYGQLGTAGPDRAAFAPVASVPAMRSLAAGFGHTLAAAGDGTLWAWGRNFSGQLGDGTLADSPAPRRVQGIARPVVAAAGGTGHSLAWDVDGVLHAWGGNAAGQLGDGTTAARPTAAPVPLPAAALAGSAGGDHSLAVLADGRVMAWGANGNGQLGDGTFQSRPTPVAVAGLSPVTRVAAGLRHSLALRTDGTVWSWGQNASGELGDGTLTSRPTPARIPSLTAVVRIAAGASFSAALRADGTVWTWGRNANGALGDGTTGDRSVPAPLSVSDIVDLAAGGEQLFLVRADGTVLAVGRNANGQLGLGHAQNPVLLPVANGLDLRR